MENKLNLLVLSALIFSCVACSTLEGRNEGCQSGALYFQYDSTSDTHLEPRAQIEFLKDKSATPVTDPELSSLFKEACKGKTSEVVSFTSAYGRIFDTKNSVWIVDDDEVAFNQFKTKVNAETMRRALKIFEGEP